MQPELNTFEKYVFSLTSFGVYPTFHRLYKGWSCVLRNEANKQIMPFMEKQTCWGLTMMEALTVAVEGLNKRFSEPKELRKYIETGIVPSSESSQIFYAEYAS